MFSIVLTRTQNNRTDNGRFAEKSSTPMLIDLFRSKLNMNYLVGRAAATATWLLPRSHSEYHTYIHLVDPDDDGLCDL